MLRSLFSGWIGLALLLGCHEGTELRIPSDAQYAPQQWLVAWPRSDQVVFLTEERWLLHDAAFVKCEESGAYEARGGFVVPLRIGWGKQICGEEVFGGKLRGRPDGLEAVFSSDSLILRWQLLTGQLNRFRLQGVSATSPPAWAPDGSMLAFAGIAVSQAAEFNHDTGLYLVQPDGSKLRSVAQFPGARVTAGPVWSPDYSHLAVSLIDESDTVDVGQVSIVIVDTTGHITSPIAMGYVQAWSPDGRWIAYVAPTPAIQSLIPSIGQGVSFTSPDGLTHNFVSVAGFNTDSSLVTSPIGVAANGAMAWSPDGGQLAVTLWTTTGMRIALVGVRDHSISLLPAASPP